MLNNLGIVVPGKLYRSAQPDAKGFADLRELGVRMVLKLNSEHEYPLARENQECQGPETPVTVCSSILSTFSPLEAKVRAIATDIQCAMEAGNCILVHCTHGRDRTGLVIGAWRLLYDHWTLDQVLAERKLYGAGWLVDLADHEILEVLERIATGRTDDG